MTQLGRHVYNFMTDMRIVSPMTTKDWRPAYVAVAEDLRDQIERGDLAPGDRLPSEPTLAVTYKLSRTSVRNAVAQLVEWGLVRSERGRGTFVRPRRQRFTREYPHLYRWEKARVLLPEDERAKTGVTEQQTGLDLSQLVLPAEYVTTTADEDLAEAFGVEVGTKMLERQYGTRSADETAPLSISRSWLVYDVAAQNPALLKKQREPWPGGTQHQLHTIGIELSRIEDRVIARAASAEEALTLELDRGTPIIAIRKTCFTTREVDGTAVDEVVEVADIVLPADRAELKITTTLEPWS